MVRLLLVGVFVVGVLLLFVFPGRVWLSQSRATARAERQLRVLTQENAALTKRAAQLQDPAYVAQIARQQFGLVLPGEQAYSILPTTTTTVPAKKPHG
jgi:cell division protein FtsB